MSDQTVISSFNAAASANPRKIAIFWGRETVTYAQLRELIDRYAANLQAGCGIRPGDRVGILLKNCPEFIYVLYAAFKSDAVVVPINNFLKAPEIQHIIDDCKLTCLVTSPDFDEIVAKLRGVSVVSIEHLASVERASRPFTLPSRTGVSPVVPSRSPVERASRPFDRDCGDETQTGETPVPRAGPAPGTSAATPAPKSSASSIQHPGSSIQHPSPLALIIYTSGTTGKPKGAILTHANIASNVHSCISALEETSNDRLTLLLPMFHSFMLTVCIFTPLSMGAASC